MAWVPVPPENRPIFQAALPKDLGIETSPLFGGVAAKVNNNFFAGLFGRSVIIWLPETQRKAALDLEGASMFDPMGDGRRSDKVMLPEAMMEDAAELKKWILRAFKAAAVLPPKATKAKKKAKVAKKSTAKKSTAKKSTAKEKRGR
jgi:hypothetical protein